MTLPEKARVRKKIMRKFKKMFDIQHIVPYNTQAAQVRCGMKLDLHKIINVPGTGVSFETGLDTEGLFFEGIEGISVSAKGTVTNHAGMLVMEADIVGELECVCARCLKSFRRPYELHTSAVLSETEPEDEESDIYLLEGDCIDTDEVLVTAFVLSLPQRQLCREDCKGLCEKCGKNLNDGPCSCRAESDPRLAVLGQLLDE